MSPRPDVSEERKDQILAGASEVFAEKGVHESRMDDIAAKSGLSKGALYWYFKSKDDILIAIFDQMFKKEYDYLDNIISEKDSAIEQLQDFTERVIFDIKRMLHLMPIAYEFISLAFRRKFVKDAFKRYVNKYISIMEIIIELGITQGEFRAVEPRDIAITISSIFEGTILLWVYDHNLVNPEEHIRKGINIVLDGIKA